MAVTGPDVIALQVRDVERAATFHEERLGLRRAAQSPPNAVVFDTAPTAFAVREPAPGLDMDAVVPQPGAGVALWLGCDGAQGLHDELAAAGVGIAVEPFDGPFGRTFAFLDPDGYAVTIHGLAQEPEQP